MVDLIYVIEDDEDIRELVKVTLETFSYNVKCFYNGQDGYEAVIKTPPSLAIFDLMLPKLDGLTAIKKIRENSDLKQLPIIMITAKDSEIDKIKGLDAGADDYITKPFGALELCARIRSLLRRAGNKKTTNNIKIKDIEIFIDKREVYHGDKLLDLTFKEFELLYLLMRNSDIVVTRDSILNQIWGYDYVGETRTLDMHIRTLRQKLENNSPETIYIKTIRGVGYKFNNWLKLYSVLKLLYVKLFLIYFITVLRGLNNEKISSFYDDPTPRQCW